MIKPAKIITPFIMIASLTALTGCGQNVGAVSLSPNHTETSNGFSLTLSKKEVGQTIQELQDDVNARQSYTGRFSNQ